MIRVKMIGDREVALAPLRRALAGVAGVEILNSPATVRQPEVDTVVVDRSLSAGTAPEGLGALAALYPGATLLVVALDRGAEYRWVHLQPHGSAFRIFGAGTGRLSTMLASSLAGSRGGQRAPGHATVPAIPCSTA